MNEFSSGGQPPCNIDLEQALLGAILCDNEVLERVALEPRHFFDPLHARIFEMAAGRINEGRLATSVTLRSAFAAEEPISEQVTAVQYLERLETAAAYDAIKNTSEYALQIKELAAYREIIAISMTAEQMARESRVAPGELAVEAIAQLDDVIAAHRIQRKTSFSIDAAAKEALERATSPDTDPPVTTGFKSLDDRIGGFYRGEFSLLAGRPSMGKSAVSVSIGLKAAKAGHSVLYFSLEMTAEAFGGRCLTDEAWHRDDPIAYKDLRRGGLEESVVRRLYYDGLKKLEGVPLYIDEQPGLRISEIVSRARRHHQFLE
ncbi:MAG: hypothetical protein L3J67_12955, partial [Hyphomicrobiaceae bacterium]|nr:hypothetical protein [Hyphomicrobiaceae bacterium]